MPKIMIIKYQQFAKTNTFSLSFHTRFSPFSPRHIEIRIWGWPKMGKNGVGPLPPNIPASIHTKQCTVHSYLFLKY